MKKVLCFGDSNTFGYIPSTGSRYDENTRWTGILAQKLGNDYKVIEAGCNNRNGFIDSLDGELFTGYKVLPRYLMNPMDIVILWIGANDIQKFYNPTLDIIKTRLDSMIKQIKTSGSTLFVISPPIINKNILNGHFAYQFDEESVEKSKLLPDLYKEVSKKNDVCFIDINQYVSVSELDGLHYSKESHSVIANTLYDFIKKL